MNRPVKTVTLASNTPFNISLPQDATLRSIDLVVLMDVTIAAGAVVDVGVERYLNLIELLVNGNSWKSYRGYEARAINIFNQGEEIPKTVPTAIGANQELSFTIRLEIQDPKGLYPQRTLFNTREAAGIETLELAFRTLDENVMYDIPANVTINTAEMQVYYNDAEVSARPVPGGNIMMVEQGITYNIDSSEEGPFDWVKRGRTIRSFLAVSRDNTPAFSDDVIDTLTLRINGKVDELDNLPWEYLKTLSTWHTGVSASEIPAGAIWFDFDPKRQGLPLLVPNLAQVELFVNKEAAGTGHELRIVRKEYVRRSAFVRG